MRWKGRRASRNVQDRRRIGPGMAVGGGLGTIVILLVAVLFGADPRALLQEAGPALQADRPTPGTEGVTTTGNPEQDELAQFMAVVLADTEDVWNALFEQMGRQYEEPTLVLFADRVQSACGFASAAVGPFYCPADNNLYLDLSFFGELHRRFGADGDFAQAYVVAHEVGHHVQNLLGISDRVHAARRQLSQGEYNDLSIRLELQADFLAGVWAHHAQRMRDILETGDIEEALGAASAVGDDNIQKQTQGHVVPDSFTHGTSAQRVRWFRKGFETGDLDQGDTFNTPQP